MKLRPAVRLLFVLIIIAALVFSNQPQTLEAQSASLSNITDLLDTPVLDATAYHSLTFTLPLNSAQINTTDYIRISLPSFSNVTAPTLVGGTFAGTPSYSVSGTNAIVTGITVVPGKTVTIEGFTASNPPAANGFTVIVAVTEDAEGTIIKNFGTTIATVFGGGINVSAEVDNPTARLQVSGFTAPSTYVIFTEGPATIGSDVAGPTGLFSKLFPAVAPADHSISLYGIDANDRTTSTINLELYTPVFQQTNVFDLLLSPTIQVDDTSILQGEPVYATGSAYPGSQITIFTDSPVRTYAASASAAGDWTYTITDTSSYIPGDYRIYTLGQSGSIQSLVSPSILFSITSSSGGTGSACGDITEGDLNCDDIINLTDFSILMFYWGTNNATADMNSDGIVNLTDFSIMMFYWGT